MGSDGPLKLVVKSREDEGGPGTSSKQIAEYLRAGNPTLPSPNLVSCLA